jgi:hypothetical protein
MAEKIKDLNQKLVSVLKEDFQPSNAQALKGANVFIQKYGSELDFRGVSGVATIDQQTDPIAYEKLQDMDETTWQEYMDELLQSGVTVEYNSVDDQFEFTNMTGEEDEEGVEGLGESVLRKKNIFYEEVEGFKKTRSYTKAESSGITFTEADFKNVSNEDLAEYSWKKGIEFTTRNSTIQKLFEFNKVTKEDLILFTEDKAKQRCNEDVSDLNIDTTDEDLDFGGIQTLISFDSSTPTYQKLDAMPTEKYQEFVDKMAAKGYTIEYDTSSDEFNVFKTPYDEFEGEGERYPIEEDEKQSISNIIESKGFKVKEIRGLLKSTGRDYIVEAIVEKNGNETVIKYNDTTSFKPWSIKDKQFQFLQEALGTIQIPFKKLVNDTVEANKKISKKVSFLEKVQKNSKHLSDKLPLSEKERRQQRGLELLKEIDTSKFEVVDMENPYSDHIPANLIDFYVEGTLEEQPGGYSYTLKLPREDEEGREFLGQQDVENYLRSEGLVSSLNPGPGQKRQRVSFTMQGEEDEQEIFVDVTVSSDKGI